VSVKNHRLDVQSGSMSILLACSGRPGARCAGLVLVAARGSVCGGGAFSMAAGDTYELQSDVNARCAALLRTARGHHLPALVGGDFSTHQGALRAAVTLVLM
jgi:hypothetical protein